GRTEKAPGRAASDAYVKTASGKHCPGEPAFTLIFGSAVEEIGCDRAGVLRHCMVPMLSARDLAAAVILPIDDAHANRTGGPFSESGLPATRRDENHRNERTYEA